MSVIGFDIGNESYVISPAKCGGVDVLLNNESKHETSVVVSFGEKQSFLGAIKRLIGKVYKEVEGELKLLSSITSEGPCGGILIELEYLKKKWTFTPLEILGMLFKHLKQMTEKNLESSVVDCVIRIPSYFSDLQNC
ncbi:putative Heat shock protein 70 family [Helianthus anomalus]